MGISVAFQSPIFSYLFSAHESDWPLSLLCWKLNYYHQSYLAIFDFLSWSNLQRLTERIFIPPKRVFLSRTSNETWSVLTEQTLDLYSWLDKLQIFLFFWVPSCKASIVILLNFQPQLRDDARKRVLFWKPCSICLWSHHEVWSLLVVVLFKPYHQNTCWTAVCTLWEQSVFC